jgi:hypothetical protein
VIPREFLAALARYAVVWVLGWLVLHGVIDADQAARFSGPLTEWVLGVGGTAVMVVWLFLRKKRNERRARETDARMNALSAMSRR